MIVGSTALHHWYPETREPADLDVWEESSVPNTRGNEYHWCDTFFEVITLYGYPDYAPPDLLLTIKMSHAPWSEIHWDKTVHDIGFLQRKGHQVNETVYKMLYTHWETLFGKKQAYLAKDNDAFFDDGVERRYVHDDLHRAIAFYGDPLYERLKPDLDKAACSRSMFEALSPADQIRCIQEEAFVIALERFLIPRDFALSPYAAYRQALKLLVTKMTKGWFSRAILDRWTDLAPKPTHDFVSLFHSNINHINHAPHIQPA